METFTLSLGRCWMIRAVGRNPLVRTQCGAPRVFVGAFVLVSGGFVVTQGCSAFRG